MEAGKPIRSGKLNSIAEMPAWRPLPIDGFIAVSVFLIISDAIGLLVLLCERERSRMKRAKEISRAFVTRIRVDSLLLY